MTPYERGYSAALKAAAKVCNERVLAMKPDEAETEHARRYIYGAQNEAVQCATEILSLPIEGEADQRGAAAIPVAQQEEGRASLGVRAGKAAQSVPHHNPGEPVAQVMYEMANDGKCGPVAWFKSPRSLPDGTMLYAHPARPGPSQECVSVPRKAWEGFVSLVNVKLNKPTNRDKTPAELIEMARAMLAAAKEE